MGRLCEPNGHSYTLEVRRQSSGWEWWARRVVNNGIFVNGKGTETTKKHAIAKGREHIFEQERKFWDRTQPFQKVKI